MIDSHFWSAALPWGSTNMAAKKVMQNIRLLKVRPLIDLRVKYFSQVSVEKLYSSLDIRHEYIETLFLHKFVCLRLNMIEREVNTSSPQ